MADKKRLSIRDVASMAGVSVATVSNVLGAKKPVSPELAARVQAAVRSLDYRADRAAAQLRSGKATVVAVLVPSLDNPFFTSIIAALEQAAQTEGYDIIVASSSDDSDIERKRLAALLSWRPAGIVILPAEDGFPARDLLADNGTPFVVIDRLAAGLVADTVAIDNRQACVLACDHLIELGHRDVLVVASTLRLANIRQRVAAIRRTFIKAALPPPEVLEVGLTLDSVARGLGLWLLENERPSGIIALTNFTTIGVIAALAQAGLRVPEDISLVGFDDYAWMQGCTPSITAIRQPVAQLGAQAWCCLRERIEGARHVAKSVRLRCTLQVRGSTRSARPIPPSNAARRKPAASRSLQEQAVE